MSEAEILTPPCPCSVFAEHTDIGSRGDEIYSVYLAIHIHQRIPASVLHASQIHCTIMASKHHVVVIGAGVIGLTSATHLAEARYMVSIIAAHMPGDTSIEYTSPWYVPLVCISTFN